MPLLPWGEWKPDTSDYESNTQAHNIANVIPRGDGYGPFADFTALTQALPSACRGAFYALKTDGTVQVFAGTSNMLYRLNNTDLSWIPVSRLAAVTSISNASPGVVTYTNTFVEAEPIVFAAGTGTLPAQLVAGTVYYVKNAGGSSFNVSATPGGTAINTTGGSGTPSITAHYASLASSAQWQFAQFGNKVHATQANETLQVYDLASGATPITFANQSGSPPQAAYVSIVGRFLVLSGLLSNPFRIQWSGLNDPTNWTSGVNSSDFQDFPDGGIVRGVAGGEFGTIFQDQAIRRMAYIPGSTLIFQIERVTQDMGLYAPYSIVRSGSSIFFYSTVGFYRIDPGALPEQIGRERVDRTFFNDLDGSNLQLFMGASDPRGTRVYWAYKSGAGSSGTYDKILGYDKVLDRWFQVSMNGEFLLGISQAGLTLENLDNLSSSIDALTTSMDAIPNAVEPEIAQFGATHKQGFFRGSNLEATLESAEQGTDGQRVMVNAWRPVTDANSFYGSVSGRETQADTPSYNTEIARNSRTGRVDTRLSTRYVRMRLRVPVGTTWTFAAGIEPDIQPDGET